jgi:hypothetical protein
MAPIRGLVSFILGLTVLIVGVVLLFESALLLIFVITFPWTFSNIPVFDTNASSITLTGVPGKTVEFSLTGSSLNAYWASQNGVSLSLSDNSSFGFDKTFNVIPPTPDTWGSTITQCVPSCDPSDGQFTIPITVKLPADLAGSGDRSLRGSLSGDIQSPQDVGNGYFQNDDTQLNIPVTVKLVHSVSPPRHGYRALQMNPLQSLELAAAMLVALFILSSLLSVIQRPRRFR